MNKLKNMIIRTFWTTLSELFFNIPNIYEDTFKIVFEDIYKNVRYYSRSTPYEMGN